MSTRFTLRPTRWGFSLYHDGELVASATHWIALVHFVAHLQQNTGVTA